MSIEKYYKSVKNIACNGVTEAIDSDRKYLDSLAKQLKISSGDAKIIEDEVFEPFRQYEKEMIKIVSVKFPLDDPAQSRLKDMRMSFNLLDKDVEVMESQIFEEKKTLDVWRKVMRGSRVSGITGFGSLWLGLAVGASVLPIIPIIALAGLATGAISHTASFSKIEPILKRRPAWEKFGSL